jgi:hypothetical protein
MILNYNGFFTTLRFVQNDILLILNSLFVMLRGAKHLCNSMILNNNRFFTTLRFVQNDILLNS